MRLFAVNLQGAGALFVVAAILMLIIVTLGLGIDPGDCAGTDSCPETWPAMVASLVLTLAIGAHGVLVITSAVAKLYKTMAKFSPVVDSDGRASNPAEEYILDAGAAEVWCELHEYLHLNTRLASPVNFKEFLIYRAKGAQALSHRCERLADSLFRATVKGLILADHQSVCSRLDELRRTDRASRTSRASLTSSKRRSWTGGSTMKRVHAGRVSPTSNHGATDLRGMQSERNDRELRAEKQAGHSRVPRPVGVRVVFIIHQILKCREFRTEPNPTALRAVRYRSPGENRPGTAQKQ